MTERYSIKGNIFKIEEWVDDNGLIRGYFLAIDCQEKPNLKLGTCVIHQSDEINDDN